jgi:cell division protein FtsB
VRASRRKSKSGLILVLLVVLVVIAVSSLKAMSLHEKSEELAVTERQLETQIENAKEKAAELENREKYMQTKRYVEDEAKNKLGLVYPDEIVIRPSGEK